MLSKFLYNLFLSLYSIGINVSAIWNPKAKKWINGRKKIFPAIRSKLNGERPGQLRSGRIWMHCASLGEFEQGRPLLEQLKAHDPKLEIVLTFFSPSGYEVIKDHPGIDHVFYLPMDSADHAKQFIEAVDPSLVLWVKYEFWYYYLAELKLRNVPTILISGIFRPYQPFFRWYGQIWRSMLKTFTHFFVQNTVSEQLLANLGFTENVSMNGDTRFDRVIEIAANFEPVPYIDSFCGDNTVIVAGSTWEEDEIELLHFVNVHPEIKFIIAPHEINEENLNDVKDEFPRSVYYSELVEKSSAGEVLQTKSNVLIIDNVGTLSRLYRYATVAYIGGGFGAEGVHNVLEAAVYGKPVVYGPVYEKFEEAIGLIRSGGGISVDGPISLETTMLHLLNDKTAREKKGKAAMQYVLENAGASKNIIQFIQEKRLLTS